MTQPVLPENWRMMLAGYVLGTSDAEEIACVEEWIQQYPDVAAEFEALNAAWHSLPMGLSPQAPLSGLEQKILAAGNPPTHPAWERRWLWGLSVGWAITAIALFSVVSENNRLRQEQLDAQTVMAQLSQSDNRLVSLSGVDGGAATGRLVIDADTRSVVLVTRDLPPLPSTEVYRLWAVVDNPVYCGQFNPDRAIAVEQWQLPDARCQSDAAQLLITSEKAASDPVPTGILVLQEL